MISATRVGIFKGQGAADPDLVMVGKQIFAPHYLDATHGVTAFIRGQASRPYVVYLTRSDVDLRGGFWEPSRDRSSKPGQGRRLAILWEIGHRVSSGDSPLADFEDRGASRPMKE